MKKMAAGKFKAPMAKAVSGESSGKRLFGFLAGEVKIGDIEFPVFLVSTEHLARQKPQRERKHPEERPHHGSL